MLLSSDRGAIYPKEWVFINRFSSEMNHTFLGWFWSATLPSGVENLPANGWNCLPLLKFASLLSLSALVERSRQSIYTHTHTHTDTHAHTQCFLEQAHTRTHTLTHHINTDTYKQTLTTWMGTIIDFWLHPNSLEWFSNNSQKSLTEILMFPRSRSAS